MGVPLRNSGFTQVEGYNMIDLSFHEKFIIESHLAIFACLSASYLNHGKMLH